jgi:hypothetical protein
MLGEPGIDTILNALPRLPGNDEINQPISLEINGDNLTLKAESKPGEWTVIPVPAKVSGLPVTICLNRAYLAKALKFGCTEIGIAPATADGPIPVLITTKGKMMVVSQITPSAATTANPPPPGANSPAPNVSAETPSDAETDHQTEKEERNPSMPQTAMAAPQRGNLNGHATEPESSAFEEMIDQISTVREGLKKVLDDLGTTEKLVRKAVKEQKLSEKEIGRARIALRSLQKVEL